MTRRLMLGFAALAAAAAADKPPKAEDILDKYVEATGGKAAYEKIRTEITTAGLEFVGKGVGGTLTMYQAAPNKSYAVLDLAGVGKIEMGTDGEVAWEKSAMQGPRIKSGEERASAMREATMHSRAFWRDLYKSAELAGEETVDGQPCHKVILTPKEGKPETRYYDKKSALMVRVDVLAKSPMGEVPAETRVEDYRQVSGILIPHRLRQKVLGQEFTTTIQTVEFNVKLPGDRFDLPDDVKALLPKP